MALGEFLGGGLVICFLAAAVERGWRWQTTTRSSRRRPSPDQLRQLRHVEHWEKLQTTKAG